MASKVCPGLPQRSTDVAVMTDDAISSKRRRVNEEGDAAAEDEVLNIARLIGADGTQEQVADLFSNRVLSELEPKDRRALMHSSKAACAWVLSCASDVSITFPEGSNYATQDELLQDLMHTRRGAATLVLRQRSMQQPFLPRSLHAYGHCFNGIELYLPPSLPFAVCSNYLHTTLQHLPSLQQVSLASRAGALPSPTALTHLTRLTSLRLNLTGVEPSSQGVVVNSMQPFLHALQSLQVLSTQDVCTMLHTSAAALAELDVPLSTLTSELANLLVKDARHLKILKVYKMQMDSDHHSVVWPSLQQLHSADLRDSQLAWLPKVRDGKLQVHNTRQDGGILLGLSLTDPQGFAPAAALCLNTHDITCLNTIELYLERHPLPPELLLPYFETLRAAMAPLGSLDLPPGSPRTLRILGFPQSTGDLGLEAMAAFADELPAAFSQLQFGPFPVFEHNFGLSPFTAAARPSVQVGVLYPTWTRAVPPPHQLRPGAPPPPTPHPQHLAQRDELPQSGAQQTRMQRSWELHTSGSMDIRLLTRLPDDYLACKGIAVRMKAPIIQTIRHTLQEVHTNTLEAMQQVCGKLQWWVEGGDQVTFYIWCPEGLSEDAQPALLGLYLKMVARMSWTVFRDYDAEGTQWATGTSPTPTFDIHLLHWSLTGDVMAQFALVPKTTTELTLQWPKVLPDAAVYGRLADHLPTHCRRVGVHGVMKIQHLTEACLSLARRRQVLTDAELAGAARKGCFYYSVPPHLARRFQEAVTEGVLRHGLGGYVEFVT